MTERMTEGNTDNAAFEADEPINAPQAENTNTDGESKATLGVDAVSSSTEEPDPPEKERKKKKKSNYEKHLVDCPHCGIKILDHFTECPHCGGKVEPQGYHADEKKLYRVRRIAQAVGLVLTVGLFIVIAVLMAKGVIGGSASAIDVPAAVAGQVASV